MAIGPVQLIVLGFEHPNFHGEIIEELEKLHIERVVRELGGRVTDAAQRLGIPRSTLYQKIKRYGICIPRS